LQQALVRASAMARRRVSVVEGAQSGLWVRARGSQRARCFSQDDCVSRYLSRQGNIG
jgi:hypothetical protein